MSSEVRQVCPTQSHTDHSLCLCDPGAQECRGVLNRQGGCVCVCPGESARPCKPSTVCTFPPGSQATGPGPSQPALTWEFVSQKKSCKNSTDEMKKRRKRHTNTRQKSPDLHVSHTQSLLKADLHCLAHCRDYSICTTGRSS